jgi:hypothetical protein
MKQKATEAIINQGILPLYFNADETVSIETSTCQAIFYNHQLVK